MPADTPNPKCPECLTETERMHSTFATPWTGTLDRHNKKGCETHNACDGGHIAYRVRSSRMADGSPEEVRISTYQQMREYTRAEGLVDPTDVNPTIEGNAEGMWGNTSGFSGQWGGTPAALAATMKASSTWRTVVDGVAVRSLDK